MAIRQNTFLLKRSNIPGNVPTTGQIVLGELALNTADVILYASGTTAGSIRPIGWDRISKTGDTMTGALYTPILSATTYLNIPIKWYAENATAPVTAPIATGLGSVAFGKNASALSSDMFVYGLNAGNGATGASNSNLFGQNVGSGATNASNSNLFGQNVGMSFTNNNIGSNNIIIGTNITLPNATANGINIGGVIFGSGTNSNTAGNPLTETTGNGKIGVNVVVPTNTFHISGATDPIRVIGLTGNTTDTNILTINNLGVVHTILKTSLSSSTSTDTFVTGGTYAPTTGIATFTNNTGGTFTVTGFVTGGGSGIGRSILINQSGAVSGASTPLTDYIYIFTSGGTLTLPTAVGNTNFYDVKNSSVVNITVVFTGLENADVSTNITLIPNQALRFLSNNTNYIIL